MLVNGLLRGSSVRPLKWNGPQPRTTENVSHRHNSPSSTHARRWAVLPIPIRSGETFAQGDGGGGRPGRYAQLAEDAVDVVSNRTYAQHQFSRNGSICPARDDQSQDLDLTVGQTPRTTRWSCLVG